MYGETSVMRNEKKNMIRERWRSDMYGERGERKKTKRKKEGKGEKGGEGTMEVDGEGRDGKAETVPAKRGASSDDEGADDWAELAREERMAKKVKRGAVSQKAFDAEFGDL